MVCMRIERGIHCRESRSSFLVVVVMVVVVIDDCGNGWMDGGQDGGASRRAWTSYGS